MAQATPSGSPWHGSLQELASIIQTIRRTHAYGRLTLRNAARLGVAHLYFLQGKLVHVISNSGDARATLQDLKGWTRATVRFERGAAIAVNEANMRNGDEQLFEEVLAYMQTRGTVTAQQPLPTSRVIESNLVATPQFEQLITPWEWRVLVEGTRRVSLAVAHLVGPREAMSVLRDILDDCSAGFPALSGLRIAASGYLEVSRTVQLDRTPRRELLEGFAALFATCQYFCAPIIGEEDAHKLLISALNDVGPALMSLGVFKVNNRPLSQNTAKNP